jgi:hypothetical protein
LPSVDRLLSTEVVVGLGLSTDARNTGDTVLTWPDCATRCRAPEDLATFRHHWAPVVYVHARKPGES